MKRFLSLLGASLLIFALLAISISSPTAKPVLLTIQRILSKEEMQAYRRPFAEPGEGRRPTLTWLPQLPFEGEPADVTEIVATYEEWLSHNSIPKLFIRADPGTMSPSSLAVCRA